VNGREPRLLAGTGQAVPDPAGTAGVASSGIRRGLLTRLRDALNRSRVEPAPQPSPHAGEPHRPELEFVGYAEDCRVFGFLRLDGDRLTDMLNVQEEIRLVDAVAIGLDDSRAIEVGELTVSRDELLAVRGSGPRGNSGRRARVRPHPITLQTGPYTIHGYVHALPGADPLLHVRRRKAMVPVTEAWIEYPSAAERQRVRVGTLIVNRELVDWIALSDDEEVKLPNLPAEIAPGPLVKDFTGYILTLPE
jgi:hypothetical protein